MADEETKTEDAQAVDVVDTTVETTTEDKHPVQTESEFMEETIADIKETQKASQVQEESVDDADADDTAKADDNKVVAGTDIPDAFTEAAEATGMTAEEIIKLADKHTDEQLLEMIPTLQAAVEDTDEVADEAKPKKGEDVADDVQQKIIEQVTQQLTEKFGVSLDELQEFKAQQAAHQEKEALATADRKFDEAAKEFSVFGKTEELPRFTTGKLAGQVIPTSPAFKARMEVVKYADAFIKSGHSVEDAMDDALALYAGKHLRKEMERSLIKDLKQHEKQLSGGRVGKETKKKYVDSREEIIDEIRQLQRQAGIEV